MESESQALPSVRKQDRARAEEKNLKAMTMPRHTVTMKFRTEVQAMTYRERLAMGMFISIPLLLALLKYCGVTVFLIVFYLALAWYKIGWIFKTDKELTNKSKE